MARTRWLSQPGISTIHRVEGPSSFPANRARKSWSSGHFGNTRNSAIHSLQQRGMIAHPIADLCRGQSVPHRPSSENIETMANSIPSTLLHSSDCLRRRGLSPRLSLQSTRLFDAITDQGLCARLYTSMTEFGCLVLADFLWQYSETLQP